MTTTASNSTSVTTTSRNPARSQLWAFIALGLLFVLVVVGYFTLFYGAVVGEEFDANSFTRRNFVYYEIPLLGFQVTPITHTPITNPLETHLTANSLVPAMTPPTARWDLVMAKRGSVIKSRVLAQGEARVLCEYLDTEDGAKNNVWLEWTKKHADLAKVVWPAVAKVARQELYVFAPDLLIRARGASDPQALQKELDGVLTEKYLFLAQTQQQLGYHDQAIELFTEALNHGPTTVQALVGRAKSLSTLGKGDKASADLAQAQSLGARL